MGINIEIQQKPKNKSKARKVCNGNEVYNLKEVQEIKGAVQEHMLFIGLDNMNNIRNVTIVGIGNGEYAPIDTKEMIRLALINVCSKVILVHNHPSNSAKSSDLDCDITKKAYKLLRTFGIQLIDHIIVTEKKHISIMEERNLKKEIDKNYDSWEYLLIVEENEKFIPRIKVSENPEKITNPGYKEVWRLYDKKTKKALGDVLTLKEEEIPDENYEIFDPVYTWKKKT
ncbi:MAG: JAB domain-containing protein, partial [Clostridia bacterium]|nr:JAB domain-containing protein [Clostridia bacterium]